MSPETAQHTRVDWRELGFFYEFDNAEMKWRLVGSRTGLQGFAELLREYAADPRNVQKSEHEHYGPYYYLKVMTWPEAGINEQAIYGPLAQIEKLASLIEQKLEEHHIGNSFVIGKEYDPDCEAVLAFEIRERDFDPASLDPELRESAI